jgi:hypothetical protein
VIASFEPPGLGRLHNWNQLGVIASFEPLVKGGYTIETKEVSLGVIASFEPLV